MSHNKISDSTDFDSDILLCDILFSESSLNIGSSGEDICDVLKEDNVNVESLLINKKTTVEVETLPYDPNDFRKIDNVPQTKRDTCDNIIQKKRKIETLSDNKYQSEHVIKTKKTNNPIWSKTFPVSIDFIYKSYNEMAQYLNNKTGCVINFECFNYKIGLNIWFYVRLVDGCDLKIKEIKTLINRYYTNTMVLYNITIAPMGGDKLAKVIVRIISDRTAYVVYSAQERHDALWPRELEFLFY
ncbi:hypothetical protein CDIK_0942 [Cucumispora dikerogammari]|nr:hypothetical protein CDIK_0942 [Cucumispora dikerogammari]